MTKSIQVITSDSHIYQPEKLVTFLWQAMDSDSDVVIDLHLEGPCCSTIGLYRLLDEFCSTSGFSKSRIKIITANLIEQHSEYNICRKAEYWYEVIQIQNWLQKNCYHYEFSPNKHFGNFIGRSTWYRLWIASQLFKMYREKTLQSFHSSLACNYVVPVTDGVYDSLGLDDLNQFACTDFLSVVDFLNKCPIIIQPTDITKVQGISTFVPVTNNQCYPLQHPANLMLEDYYSEIFVDIVCETKVLGNSLFLSEKTWRPIIAQRPFITMSNLNAVKNLQKLGFRTFNQWWDESYDDYSDQDRVKEILKVIDTIASWPMKKCHQVLKEMQPVLNHNYQVFKNLTIADINKRLGISNG